MTADAPEIAQPPREMTLSIADSLDFARNLLRRGQIDNALAVFTQLHDVIPDDPVQLHFHGVALHMAGQSEKGVALIETSLALQPDNEQWWSNAANVLRKLGRFDEATDALQRAITLKPDFADAYNNLGLVQRARRNTASARACFEKAIELKPASSDFHANLGDLLVSAGEGEQGLAMLMKAVVLAPHDKRSRRSLAYAYMTLGMTAQAIETYQSWLDEEPDNPIPLHHLAALRGEKPARASDAYVRSIFDSFASTFDQKLRGLDYQAPELVNAAVVAHVSGRLPESGLDILDAGCGTGLCAEGLKPLARRLAGVDLSPEMLARAKATGLYDELTEGELVACLTDRPQAHDLIVSADTLCYFGDLAPVFAAAASSLRPSGAMAFTVEKAADPDSGFALMHHGRYQHAHRYVEATLLTAGFQIVSCEEAVLRNENLAPVHGFVVMAALREGGAQS
jgi:predicted TPR repeat methyltransferase